MTHRERDCVKTAQLRNFGENKEGRKKAVESWSDWLAAG